VSRSTQVVYGVKLAALLAAFLLPAIPQPADYHAFADRREALGIANLADVLSNLAFVGAGGAGLAAIATGRARFHASAERWPYVVFFAGVLLTGFGSAYYHLAPDNARLFWDRLPMTVAFMGLVSAQMVERIDVRKGLALLAPLVALGVLSVVYWRATERAGAGNVVPYAVLQATAVFVLLLLAILKPSRYTRGPDLYWVFLAYVLAKIFEALDREIFSLGGLVSGHTLKHLAAGAAAGVVVRMLLRRSVRVGRHG
jgi:hypothetical protein